MPSKLIHSFKAKIEIIGVNPFVFVPAEILQEIFKKAGADKGPIPIRGTINKIAYRQTLVRYGGNWRMYVNTTMLKNSPKRIVETVEVTISFDASDRTIAPHSKLLDALAKNPEAKKVFAHLSPSRQKEIVRYIAGLKTEATIDKNVQRAIDFLLGNGRFVGRDK